MSLPLRDHPAAPGATLASFSKTGNARAGFGREVNITMSQEDMNRRGGKRIFADD